MKAKTISESVNFQRGLDSKASLKVGRYSPEFMIKERQEFVDKLAYELGIYSYFENLYENVWEWKIEDINTHKKEFEVPEFSETVFYSPTPKVLYDIHYSKKYPQPEKIVAPWIMILAGTNYHDRNDFHFLTYQKRDDLIREILKNEYSDSEAWNYLERLENRIKILKSK